MRFTVVSLTAVDDALMDLWLAAEKKSSEDAKAVTEAADWFEIQLRNNPLSKVTSVDNLYFIRRDPLVALCEINVDDRLVRIVHVHRVDES